MSNPAVYTALMVVGARPNFVKIAPICEVMQRDSRLRPRLVHTGQHYDPKLSEVFFRELGITLEPEMLGVGSGTHAEQTGAVMTALERAVSERRPDVVVTVGDVNSTLAAALVAAKAGIPQAHVEAGLRSGDATMPEEVNRVVTDRLADLLFTHSEEADANLRREGVPQERIRFVGNVMIDTLLRLRSSWQGHAQRSIGDLPAEYGVVTLHRPSNVDDPVGLARTMARLTEVSRELPLIFPVHPRTAHNLQTQHSNGVRTVEPLGYLPFLDLVEHARLVITDSGGIQEETTMLGVPCLTLRSNTERPITVRLGTNRLLGADPDALPDAARRALAEPPGRQPAPPLWDGHAAERITAAIIGWLDNAPSLRLSACHPSDSASDHRETLAVPA